MTQDDSFRVQMRSRDVVDQYVELVDSGEMTLDEAAGAMQDETGVEFSTARMLIDANAQLEGEGYEET